MKKVLIVDDTKNIRVLLTKCLQMEGYEVCTADDGYKAIEVFKNESFDLVFLDIKMPYFSGTEVLKKIREMGINTPVIIITAYATIKNAVECTQLGAVAYLQKPFTAEKVRNVLSELSKSLPLTCMDEADYISVAESFLKEGRYTDAHAYLIKMLPAKSLEKEIYCYLSRASEGLGKTEDAEKYMKIYEGLGKLE